MKTLPILFCEQIETRKRFLGADTLIYKQWIINYVSLHCCTPMDRPFNILDVVSGHLIQKLIDANFMLQLKISHAVIV